MQTPMAGCDLRVPQSGGPWPAVLLLQGSGGGGARFTDLACRFAEQGFAALACTYLVPPAALAPIDIDRIEATLE
jgi:dienelactone hydrolase